ncbi:MAG: hypothetical protein O2895_01240 [Chloroflexi bacterium]|nr:hypothetical protein [Chloroflexota bacterium]
MRAASGGSLAEGASPDPSIAARTAVRGLAALRLFGLAALAASAVVWWATLGAETFEGPARAALAVLAGALLAVPGLLVLHFERSLRRAASMVVELVEQREAGARFDDEPWLFWRSVRLGMRQRGIGLLAAPWYWLLVLWAFGASGLLLIGAFVIAVAALL